MMYRGSLFQGLWAVLGVGLLLASAASAGVTYYDYTASPVSTTATVVGDGSDYPPNISLTASGAIYDWAWPCWLHVYVWQNGGGPTPIHYENGGSLEPGAVGGAMTGLVTPGETIDASSAWLSSAATVFSMTEPGTDSLEGYVGFQEETFDGTMYGWARVRFEGELVDETSCTLTASVLELGVSNVGGEPIIVGQAPEPATMAILGAGALALLRRRRK